MPGIKLDPLPMDEAIDFFKDKLSLTPAEYKRLSEEVKVKAFTVSGYTSLEILNEILKELTKALTEGITVNDFRKSVNEMLINKGYDGFTPFQADNIFRTNIQIAYNVGRYKQMTDPDILRSRPYWLYDAVNDSHTRPTHLALDGTVRAADDPFWNTWYPPNGFRCRCGVRSQSLRDIERKGLQVQTGPSPAFVKVPIGTGTAPLLPDPGFAYNPGKVAWQPDLKKYPEQLKKIYEQRMAKKQ